MITVLPNAWTDSSTDLLYTVGAKAEDPDTGDIYEYVKVASTSANACSAGRLMYYSGTSGEVTDDYSDLTVLLPAGIGVGAIAISSYGWILKEAATVDILKTATTASAGGFVVPSSTDGKVDAITIGTAIVTLPVVGTILADTSAGVATVPCKIAIL